MHKIFTKISCGALLLCTTSVFAQDSTLIKTEKMPLRLLTVPNPLENKVIESKPERDPITIELDSFQKDILRRITDIYQLHVLSLESQLDDNPLEAETHINDAVNASQALLDDYPELRSDRRFVELSRAVISEYRQFYGISESANEAQGEIFAIQEELFADDDAYLNEDFDFPKDVMLTKTDVPLIQNRYVTNSLVYYTLKRPEVMELWLQRSETYMPMIQKIKKKKYLLNWLI